MQGDLGMFWIIFSLFSCLSLAADGLEGGAE